MSRDELILYATPFGPLGEQLDALDEELQVAGPTTAQTYPPHCTLTGFFHRRPAAVPRIVDEVAQTLAEVGPCPVDGVEIVALRDEPGWIGLELRSDWLLAVTAGFVARHRVEDGDDALRPKDWPHVSIAYGDGDMAPAQARLDRIDPTLPAAWRIGLWRRGRDGSWARLGP